MCKHIDIYLMFCCLANILRKTLLESKNLTLKETINEKFYLSDIFDHIAQPHVHIYFYLALIQEIKF